MLAAFTCGGCSSAPLTQYINNPIYQELTEEDEFTDTTRDDRIYVDMRRSKGYTDITISSSQTHTNKKLYKSTLFFYDITQMINEISSKKIS